MHKEREVRILQELLTPNEYSRPQTRIRETLAVVMHWTANPDAGARGNRNFFESRKTGMGGFGSAHYIIGQDGDTIQCIPEDEVAYHCGTSRTDPASGQVYTDWARRKLGHYAVHWRTESPNFCTVGIELCPTDYDGHFTDATIKSAVELCADILKRHSLTADDITTHHDIVGWKDCPRLWTRQPELLDAFRASVKHTLGKAGA